MGMGAMVAARRVLDKVHDAADRGARFAAGFARGCLPRASYGAGRGRGSPGQPGQAHGTSTALP
jgi:hypothetical protein